MNTLRFSFAVLFGLLAFYAGWWAIASPWYLAIVLWWLAYRNGLRCLIHLVAMLASTLPGPIAKPHE